MQKDKLEKKVDAIAVEVVKHMEAIDKMQVDLADLKDNTSRLLDGHDKMMVILQRLDQERIFTVERIRRLEEEVGKIKAHLALS